MYWNPQAQGEELKLSPDLVPAGADYELSIQDNGKGEET
jgi:hypothetical protein